MRTTTTSYSIGPRTSYFFHVFNLSYKSRGPGQAKPEPSRGWWLWPGLGFQKAKAVPGQAKAPAFRPSRAGTTLVIAAAWTENRTFYGYDEELVLLSHHIHLFVISSRVFHRF